MYPLDGDAEYTGGVQIFARRRTQVRDYMKRTLTVALLLFLPCYSHAVEVESIGVYLFYNESGSFLKTFSKRKSLSLERDCGRG